MVEASGASTRDATSQQRGLGSALDMVEGNDANTRIVTSLLWVSQECASATEEALAAATKGATSWHKAGPGDASVMVVESGVAIQAVENLLKEAQASARRMVEASAVPTQGATSLQLEGRSYASHMEEEGAALRSASSDLHVRCFA